MWENHLPLASTDGLRQNHDLGEVGAEVVRSGKSIVKHFQAIGREPKDRLRPFSGASIRDRPSDFRPTQPFSVSLR